MHPSAQKARRYSLDVLIGASVRRQRSRIARYYGDNLDAIRDSIATESVDLIYLDPPFNSQANYNLLFRYGPAAILGPGPCFYLGVPYRIRRHPLH
jgi:hypothetical protein